MKSITDYNVIESVVKLSDKYQVDRLLRQSLPIFTVNYPSTLKHWDTRKDRRQYKPLATAYGKALPVFVIQLARTTGMDILLPSAYLECCSLSIDEILYGVPTPDGKILCLGAHDQVMIFHAREKLSHLAQTEILAIFQSEEETGQSEGTMWRSLFHFCALWRRVWQWMQGVEEAECWVNPLTIPFPTDILRIPIQNSSQIVTRYQSEKKYRNARQDIWNELPVMFDLLPWNKMKREALHK